MAMSPALKAYRIKRLGEVLKIAKVVNPTRPADYIRLLIELERGPLWRACLQGLLEGLEGQKSTLSQRTDTDEGESRIARESETPISDLARYRGLVKGESRAFKLCIGSYGMSPEDCTHWCQKWGFDMAQSVKDLIANQNNWRGTKLVTARNR